MLIQFRFENYKSFRDETILDLSATKITEHASRVIELGNEKILPGAAIYGANASGKSNVIDAFRFMNSYVLESFAYGGEDREKRNKNNELRVTPFLFDKTSIGKVSLFEVYFIDKKDKSAKTYNYGFTLDQTGVQEEWLNVKAKTAKEFKSVFYREGNKFELDGIPGKSRENIEIALEPEVLIVSLGAKLKIEKLKKIRDWFYDNNFIDFGNPIENAFLSRMLPENFAENVEVQEHVVKYLAAFDPSIIGFEVNPLNNDASSEQKVRVNAIHRIADSDDTAVIPLEDESAGTLKMFTLYPVLQDTLKSGGVLMVDELNARLHPLLLRRVILTFLNPEINTNHAQLVFTTHDAWQLSNDLLRRDEIWFTAKDSAGVTELYSLADFVDYDGDKIRKDENYEKNYLLGKYGAIPVMKSFNMFKGE